MVEDIPEDTHLGIVEISMLSVCLSRLESAAEVPKSQERVRVTLTGCGNSICNTNILL